MKDLKPSAMQVIIASGPANESRAILGMAYALAAAASNTEVTVFFTMEGAAWTDTAHGHSRPVPGFESINDYWNLLTEAGAVMEGCHSCVENYRNGSQSTSEQRPGMVTSGLSAAAMRGSIVHTTVF